jgi:hypothetical protein
MSNQILERIKQLKKEQILALTKKQHGKVEKSPAYYQKEIAKLTAQLKNAK